ncbi:MULTISPECIES: PD-(D/E)XK nuclease family protein [Nostocales]|uniref:PD-(D/E)XK nuclease family protein n=2 Tax=Nostocales TaxID=1161 RepID=A0ABW8WFX4_9CYAN|nr:PD-(D/E)XK nuclease family protein [Tolypothrix bouteillei]
MLRGSTYAGQFCYVADDDLPIPGNTYYSVGAIQGQTKDPKSEAALQKWERQVGKQEAERIRNEAVGAGKAAHAVLHSRLTGEVFSPVSSRYEPYLRALEQVLPNFDQPLLSEQMVVNFKYRYYGVIDQLCPYKGKLTLSDLKTSSKAKTLMDWIQDKVQQLTAYYLALESLYDLEQAALLYLIGDATHDEFIFTPAQMELYKHNWLERLDLFRRRELVGFDSSRLEEPCLLVSKR